MKSFQIPLTLLVFLISCLIGLSIAQQKPLWTDELSTEGIDFRSGYWDLITGNSTEGTKAPVVYCFQKFIDQIFSYKLPENLNLWHLYFDKKAQVVCRIGSILWMSLTIALIFYYFTRYTALWAGLSALLITLSTYMVWGYWAEERSYSFWFLCSSVQALTILWSTQHTHKRSTVVGFLMLANILLSLTVTIGLFQIIAVSIWMYFAGYRKITDYILTTVIPLVICFLYYKETINFCYIFLFPAWKMITANIPLERIILLFAGGLYLWRRPLQLLVQDRKNDLNVLSYFGLIFAAGVGLLLSFKMREGNHPGFSLVLNGRHLIFLSSLGIIASTFIFVRLMQANSSKVVRATLVLLLVLLTVPRIWKYTHFSYVTGGPQYAGSLIE